MYKCPKTHSIDIRNETKTGRVTRKLSVEPGKAMTKLLTEARYKKIPVV